LVNHMKINFFLFFYLFFIFIFFLIFFIRLFQLTIVKGNYYWTLSENNRLREIIIEPERGEIFDRKGFSLVKNTPADIPHLEKYLQKKNLEMIKSPRVYQLPEIIAPFIGYQQLADQQDLINDNCQHKLKPGEKVGKKGVEKLLDCDLRGIEGKMLVEIDAQGKFLRLVNLIPSQPGNNIKLSLDLELQKKAYDLVKDKKAAVVALKPKTGEILVLVSTPSFNPAETIANYFSDKNKPLFNRATEGVYPPGSLFKLIIATAALEEGAINEKTQIEDTGILHAGSLTFGNWYYLQYGKTEGMVDIVKAIRRSNDIFFYKAGEKTGVNKIKKWAEIFGLGKATGIGLDEEEGLIPSAFWKEETIKDRWYLGDTYNLSIGQGYVGVTPLQMAMVTSVFANNGYLCQPKLLKDEKPNCKKLPISQKTLNLVREGMKEACSPGGTGWPLFEFKIKNEKGKIEQIQTACKTGTAETPDKTGQPHAWITVFAPYENPEIVLTILIEEGGQGSDVAGPIAKELLKTYFERSQ